MSGHKQLRGLLDMFGSDSALPEGAVEDFVPGLGWGATEQARQWASIGRAIEASLQNRRPAHRPARDPMTHKDAVRAFAAWQMCQNLRRLIGKPDARISNRELIRVIRLVEKTLGILATEKIFPEHGNIEASLSRGKKILEIDDGWNSKVCEEVRRTLPKTTD